MAIQLAANLSFLFKEESVLDRFKAAKKVGEKNDLHLLILYYTYQGTKKKGENSSLCIAPPPPLYVIPPSLPLPILNLARG